MDVTSLSGGKRGAKHLRVLHVVKAMGRGGAEKLLLEAVHAVDRTRFTVDYCVLRDRPNALIAPLRAAGARVYELQCQSEGSLLFAAVRLARLIRSKQYDVVHAHLPLAGVVARVACRFSGVPVVYTEHNIPCHYHWITRIASKLTWAFQKGVIAVSRDVANAAETRYGTTVPIRVIYNGVNTELFDPATRPSFVGCSPCARIPSDGFVVGTASGFRDTPQKRLDLWIDSVARVMSVFDHVHAIIVGDGTVRSRLEGQARAAGLSERFHFAGHQSDVRPFLLRMNIFLMTSAYEGFGVAPLEAMAMGIPVVSTDVSGVREVVLHGHTGLLVAESKNSVEDISNALERLVRNPDLALVMGRNGRQVARERFSIDRMQRDIEQVYDSLVARPRVHSMQ